jgi:hypothetical protein
MTLPDEVLTLWLPVALAALLGIIGLLRGAGREVVVAAAVTLGALIYQQWGNLWAIDLNSMASGITVGWAKFTLGLLILTSTTLFVGYLLGNRLVDAPMSAGTRLMGGLLGLLNGAAIAGWVLRYAYDGLNARALLSDPVSDGFMIWAGWYPVVLAVLGTLFSILGPLRRARAAVERPSASSDWTPTPAPTAADTRVLPVQSGAATVALPVTDVRAYQPSSTDKIESVPMWDRPRVALPEERATEPVPVFADSAPAQEASWLGGQEPSSGETVPASATVSLTSEVNATEKTGGVCKNCGSPMLPGAAFCTNCGTRVEQG